MGLETPTRETLINVLTASSSSQDDERAISTPRWRHLLFKACEILPAAVALGVIFGLVVGPFWFPNELLIGVLIFEAYWLWKSWTIGYHALKGVRLMRADLGNDWRAEHEEAAAASQLVLAWHSIRHVVIVPNYGESLSKLRATLDTLARTRGAAENVIPVLAMEEAEENSGVKGERLAAEYAECFFDVLVTVHPSNLPGEVRGKSSNEAWAARQAVRELVDDRGFSLDHLTVTSCDADTQFPSQYFEALTHKFATDPERYRRFWQAPIFFYNNIWQVPASLRVLNALSGLIHLSRLSRRRRVLFSQSTYSLSMRLAHDVGYWDVDVIPEDWHMFLKCFYLNGGDVEVEPLMLPLGNDGALSSTQGKTLVNHYLQVRRWGWGASDIPYAVQQTLDHPEIPLRRRVLRFWYLLENHISWSTQWFVVTLGSLLPPLSHLLGSKTITPAWFYLQNQADLSFLPGWLTLSSLIMTPCFVPFILLIVLDARLRPPAPTDVTRAQRIAAYTWWVASSPITFIWSTLPALDAQVRLMLGKRMDYRVTEKV
jgi:Glycosyl transferase family group 2